ncbi:MAG TPA: CopG family antitoxin [Thermoanaerobaculia bacterium]|nr:CopG family antitoxin [Thermoanaerobaculia bacterium]
MSENKTSISEAASYAEIGEYWDNHDLSEYWEQTQPAEFEVDVRGSSIYFPLERNLAVQLRTAAEAHGVSPETLLNLWVKERVAEEARSK